MEASFTHSQDSLTCKFSSLSARISFTNFDSFLDLRSLLDRMNDFRNLGNANAALATLNFNQHDRFVDKFLHRLFRLIGEDAPKARRLFQ